MNVNFFSGKKNWCINRLQEILHKKFGIHENPFTSEKIKFVSSESSSCGRLTNLKTDWLQISAIFFLQVDYSVMFKTFICFKSFTDLTKMV